MKRQRLINGKWVDIPDEDKFDASKVNLGNLGRFPKQLDELRKPDRKRKHTKSKMKRCKRK
jgi:hypothetical protein